MRLGVLSIWAQIGWLAMALLIENLFVLLKFCLFLAFEILSF